MNGDIEILINYTHLVLALRDNREGVLFELENAEEQARAFHDQAVRNMESGHINQAIVYQDASRHHTKRAMAYRLAIQDVEQDM